MGIFTKYFKVGLPPQEKIPEVEKTENIFQCHYCQKGFELDSKKIFPMAVQSIGKDYMYPAQGIKCPYCFKDCICN